jgi:hypothetical protein
VFIRPGIHQILRNLRNSQVPRQIGYLQLAIGYSGPHCAHL